MKLFNPNVRFEVFVTGLFELIGVDDQVGANEYSKSVAYSFADRGGTGATGDINSICLYSGGEGSILTPAGWLYIFDKDPQISAGATQVDFSNVCGTLRVESSDWDSDTSGGVCHLSLSVQFAEVESLYFSFRTESAFNTLAGDNEFLNLRVWYGQAS